MNDTDEEFIAVGDGTVRQLRSWAELDESSCVVDIGCGYGRLAHALLRWADFRGQYVGLDVPRKPLRWCSRTITRLAPATFSFVPIDVQNDRYNPRGTLDASQIRLPLGSATADVVVLLSVFTHMYSDQIVNYLKETHRILVPGGHAFATFFLLNESWETLAQQGKPAYSLSLSGPNCCARFMSADEPLHAAGYDERWVLQQFRNAELSVIEPVRYGSWAGRDHRGTFQDLVIARRDARPASSSGGS